MDKLHREILERCLHRMECRGQDIDAVLAALPEHAEQLRPYLHLTRALQDAELPPPRDAAQQETRQALLDRVAASSPRRYSLTSLWRPQIAPIACALVVFALLAGGLVGSSSAAGHDGLLSGILSRLPVGWTADQKPGETQEAVPEDGTAEPAPVAGDDDPEAEDGPAGIEPAAQQGNTLNEPPGHGGTPPGQDGEPPGQSGEPPGHGGTPPGQDGEPPGQSAEPPGHGGTPPGQDGEPPGQSGEPPGQGGTPPGQDGEPPGQSGEPPGHGGTPPGQDREPPGQSGEPPGSQGQPRGQQGNPPGQNPGNGAGQGRSGQNDPSDQGGPQGQGKGGPDGGKPGSAR